MKCVFHKRYPEQKEEIDTIIISKELGIRNVEAKNAGIKEKSPKQSIARAKDSALKLQ